MVTWCVWCPAPSRTCTNMTLWVWWMKRCIQRVRGQRSEDGACCYEPSGPWPDGLYCSVTGPAENKQSQEERKNKPSAPDLRSDLFIQWTQDNSDWNWRQISSSGLMLWFADWLLAGFSTLNICKTYQPPVCDLSQLGDLKRTHTHSTFTHWHVFQQ